MFRGSSEPGLDFDRQDFAIGALAILFAVALQATFAHYFSILKGYRDHQIADSMATVIVAALTFYVNKTPALARWWLGVSVAVLGRVLFYSAGWFLTQLLGRPLFGVRAFLVPAICYGLSFGPLAWTAHCFLRPLKDAGEEDAHEELLHEVGDCTDPKFNIVFVHGIAGHHRTTWQTDGNEAGYWPAWVAQEFPDAQVYALHYNAAPSQWLGPTMPLIDRGKNLLNLLLAKGTFRLPSVFIVHSFGGLVLKQLWRSAQDQRRQEVLDSIKAIIFLATPHQGSLLAYLKRMQLLRVAGRTTQTAEDLEHHNQLLRDLDEYYRTHPVAKNFVYYETQKTRLGLVWAKVVDESSASLALPEVYPVGLAADHLTICKPSSSKHDIAVRIRSDLETIHSFLFGRGARPDRYEIEKYEIRLAVEPQEMQDFQCGEGSNRRTVRCDNIAKLDESVTFAPDNQFRTPFLLRYSTKRNGFITYTPSHTNEATAEENARYKEYLLDVTFRFTPEAGETYRLYMEIYKGFDDGQRCMARRLVAPAHYKQVCCTLDLTAYVKENFTVPKDPQLYLHFNYDLSATSKPIGDLLPPKKLEPNVWQWELNDVDKGVLNLIFDVTPPAGATRGATLLHAGDVAPTNGKLSTSRDLDDVFHPQKYRIGRGTLNGCRFQIMSPQYRKQFKWDKLADVLVEVAGGLPEEHWGKEAYLIPSGRARPLFWDANNLRAHKDSLQKKRAATQEFIRRYENRELQGYWFTMKVKSGEGIGVYSLDYDLFLNASVDGKGAEKEDRPL